MKTCRTCVHCDFSNPVWAERFKEQIGPETAAACRIISSCSKGLGALLYGALDGEDSLYVDPDKFGCLLHEEVTTNEKPVRYPE